MKSLALFHLLQDDILGLYFGKKFLTIQIYDSRGWIWRLDLETGSGDLIWILNLET